MKKNVYGNIEDLLVSVDMITPKGHIHKLGGNLPRISAGPDLNHIVLGSEGLLTMIYFKYHSSYMTLLEYEYVRRTSLVIFPDLTSYISSGLSIYSYGTLIFLSDRHVRCHH